MAKKDPIFLTLAEIIDIHKNQIELYGGQDGIRDISLLQSAIAQPEASFSGQWLHPDIFLMAGAYSFHICQNHPFLDGNKRTALATALVFLEMNDISLNDPQGILFGIVMDLAEGKIDKTELSQIFENLNV